MADTFEDHALFGRTLKVGEWRVEPQLNKMTRGEHVIQLEPKVMQVLLCMAEQPGQTVTKERFMDEVWAGTVVTDDVLSRCISELRKALGDDTREPEYIETIRKTGYRLIAPVAVLDVEARATEKALPRRSRVTVVPWVVLRWLRRRFLSDEHRRYWAWGIAFLIVGIFLGALFWGESNEPVVEAPPETIPFTSYPGVESDPAISPSGQQVAFSWDGASDGHRNIYVKQSSSETPLRITSAYASDFSPTWSPDGQQVAFARVSGTTHSVHVASSLGGSERRVKRFGTREIHSLAWSPDTTRQVLAISVRQTPHGPYHIEMLDMDADSSWLATTPPPTVYGDTYPAFSADGTSLSFVRKELRDVHSAYVVPVEGGQERQVTFENAYISGIAWMPDGEYLLIASTRDSNSGLWRVPVRGGTATWVMALSERSRIQRPTLSRQGNRLAYAQRFSATNISAWEQEGDVYQSNPFISSTRWDLNPALAPDDEHVAFVSERSGYREIWRTTRTDNEPGQLTDLKSPLTSMPRWSPDNEMIAFVSGTSQYANIFVMDAEGGAPRALTEDGHNDIMPSWSRDGEWIYFASDRSGEWQIWTVSISSGNLLAVTEDGGYAAQESVDGSSLYVVRPDTAGIWQIPLDERFDAPIVQANMPVRRVSLPASSTSDTDTSPELLVPWLSPRDYANWKVTDEGIYFIRRRTDATVLSLYHLGNNTIRDVTVVGELPYDASFDISKDGQWFLLSQKDRDESDVMLVNHFR